MKTLPLFAAALALAALPGGATAATYAPPYDQLGKFRAQGEDPCFHVNEYGGGNYVRGPDGSFGCYPAGSDAARELEYDQYLKCRYAPRTC